MPHVIFESGWVLKGRRSAIDLALVDAHGSFVREFELGDFS